MCCLSAIDSSLRPLVVAARFWVGHIAGTPGCDSQRFPRLFHLAAGAGTASAKLKPTCTTFSAPVVVLRVRPSPLFSDTLPIEAIEETSFLFPCWSSRCTGYFLDCLIMGGNPVVNGDRVTSPSAIKSSSRVQGGRSEGAWSLCHGYASLRNRCRHPRTLELENSRLAIVGNQRRRPGVSKPRWRSVYLGVNCARNSGCRVSRPEEFR